jgi:hypothetical protein
MFKLINRKTKQSVDTNFETLVTALMYAIDDLLVDIKSLREDLEDLTDFVEDNLD